MFNVEHHPETTLKGCPVHDYCVEVRVTVSGDYGGSETFYVGCNDDGVDSETMAKLFEYHYDFEDLNGVEIVRGEIYTNCNDDEVYFNYSNLLTTKDGTEHITIYDMDDHEILMRRLYAPEKCIIPTTN